MQAKICVYMLFSFYKFVISQIGTGSRKFLSFISTKFEFGDLPPICQYYYHFNITKMTKYLNRSGNSGVYAYETESDQILVQFTDGSVYLYNYSVPGIDEVEHMKQLATSGLGLNSYIGRNIRKRYASKIR